MEQEVEEEKNKGAKLMEQREDFMEKYKLNG